MIITRRSIEDGQMIPKGYGIAYRNFDTDTYICYPFPYNVIVGLVRKYYLKIRWYYIKKSEYENFYMKAFIDGYNRARTEDSKFLESMRNELISTKDKLYVAEELLQSVVKITNGKEN